MTGTTVTAGPAGWHNPLRDKRDKRMPRIAGPCGVVIFGVTGDLSRKKLMPAIYDLANRGLLPPSFALIGFARRDWADQDFGQIVHDAVREHARTPFRQEVWERLAEGIRFVQGSFDDDASFAKLAETLEKLDAERGTGGNHAFYLAIPPNAFPVVCEQLKRSGLADPQGGRWSRVVIEKPFGHDLQSATAEALTYLDQSLNAGFQPGMGHLVPDRMFWAQAEDDETPEGADTPTIPSASATPFDMNPHGTKH